MERRDELDNHQRAIWDEAYAAGLDALAEALHAKPKNSDERRAFIRTHVSRLDVAALSSRDGTLLLDPAKAWQLARELWAAKPEDC